MRIFLYKYLAILLACTFVSFYAIEQLNLPLTGIDDANIFFVYARNIANGNGIVFYPHTQPVEGITSLLWLFFITPAFIINKKPELILLGVNVIILSGGLAFFVHSIDNSFEKPNSFLTIFSAIALCWAFFSPTYILWAVLSLMDTGISSTLLLCEAGLLMLIYSSPDRDYPLPLKIGAVILLVTAVWIRPEGFIWSSLFLMLLLYHTWISEHSLRITWLRNRIYMAAWLISILGITVFRLAYFGYPLPNTYYAKVAPSIRYNMKEGIHYFTSFISSSWLYTTAFLLIFIFFVVFAIIFVKSLIRKSDRINRSMAILPGIAIALVSLLLPILTGGDHFMYFRFYQPAWPLFSLPIIWLFSYFYAGTVANKKIVLGSALTTVLILIFLFTKPNWLLFKQADRIAWEYQVTLLGRSWAHALNTVFQGTQLSPRAGEIAVGGFSYEYRGEVIDLMGLNNVEMAHSEGDRHGIKNHAAFNKSVFFSQQPEILLPRLYDQNILPKDFSGCGHPLFQEALKNLICDPEFHRLYQPASFEIPSDGTLKYLFVFIRKDYLNIIKANGINFTLFQEDY